MRSSDKPSLGDFESRIESVKVASGKEPADLVVVGGQLVNVNIGKIEKADIAIKGSRVAVIGDVDYTVGKKTEAVEVDNAYICPGLIDAHIHIDDSLLTVTGFAGLAIPHGTITVIQDSHEIGNPLGMKGVMLFREEVKHTPLRVFFTAPSSVPSVPELETTMEIDSNEVEELLKLPDTVGLAEVMDYFGVIDGKNPDVRRKIQLTIEHGKVVDGHFSNLEGKDLQAYVAVGNQSDHEARDSTQVIDRLRMGLKVMINGARVKELLGKIVEEKLDTRHCLIDTDDRHAGDIAKFGLMDYNIREVIKVGIEPVKAVQMGTLNTAEYFGLERDLGSIGPGKLADLVVIDNFDSFKVKKVFSNGRLVADEGKLLVKIRAFNYPNWAKDTVKIKKNFNVKDLEVRASGKDKVKVRVVVSRKSSFIETLQVKDDCVQPDINKDVVKIAVIERYGKNGNVGVGFIYGTGIKRGAAASSITHDSHNISVAGANDQDMYYAVKRLEEIHGGYVVVDNRNVLEELSLPIAGIMTQNTEEAIEKQERLREAARSIGLTVPSFGMTYALPGYPGRGNRGETHWVITDMGLVDYQTRKTLNIIVED